MTSIVQDTSLNTSLSTSTHMRYIIVSLANSLWYANIYLRKTDKNTYKISSVSSYMAENKFEYPQDFNFCVKNDNKFNPTYFIEWLFSNKSKYEKSDGFVIKIVDENMTNEQFRVIYNKLIDVSFKFCNEDEDDINSLVDIISSRINNYTIKYQYFNIDFSDKFYHQQIAYRESISDDFRTTLDMITGNEIWKKI